MTTRAVLVALRVVVTAYVGFYVKPVIEVLGALEIAQIASKRQ